MDKKEAGSFLSVSGKNIKYYSIKTLEKEGLCELSALPFSIRVLIENVLRNVDNYTVTNQDVKNTASWKPTASSLDVEVPFKPSRVLLQDFTGVPAVVDLVAMRAALHRMNSDPNRVNPLVPVDLVIDHSVQVDFFGTQNALLLNIDREFERNSERYALLKWAQRAFKNFRVSPPGRGIVHQVNLEYLSKVIDVRPVNGEYTAFPDTLLGTDSHTPMVNSLGVLGWGVGGIEAEAVMLGQPYYMPLPEVIGVRLTGELPEGATATDLVLTITEKLRGHDVVGKFVEYHGPGLRKLSIPDRATVANMAPEYGATIGFFPIDDETLSYLRLTGRDDDHVQLVEQYAKVQGLFHDEGVEPRYTEVIEIDMSEIEPSIAGPMNPEDRVPLREAKKRFLEEMKKHLKQAGIETTVSNNTTWFYEGGSSASGQEAAQRTALSPAKINVNSREVQIGQGAVTISAITSCTNTSNPTVMVAAGLLAKKAVERGLKVQPYVKTSLAPGSMVVTEYLEAGGLLPYLNELGYNLVGYGCTTCIGNSGPLLKSVEEAIENYNLYTVAVLSGNRNFAGRIHPLVRGSYLMSPILVVAYGLAGRLDIDLLSEPLGYDTNGRPVYLREVWPSMNEIKKTVATALKPEMFRRKYADVFKGEERWEKLAVPLGDLYQWDQGSTYVQEPPFFMDMNLKPLELKDIREARVLALLGDRVTTDHISPAGAISPKSPAGEYLLENGVSVFDFNTYGARRGNYKVMVRGTLANIRLKNHLVPDREGWWTIYLPSQQVMSFYEASQRYQTSKTPLIVIAGKQYGTGSSRDWAAKGVRLLGVRVIIAESYERIHRSNLVGMGVLPLQFEEGQSWRSLGLTGREKYDIKGIADDLHPKEQVKVRATSDDGTVKTFDAIVRLDMQTEVEYYKHGGILQYVLRKLAKP